MKLIWLFGVSLVVACGKGPSVCGNLVTEADEECDNGNIIIGDGCLEDCTLEVCGDGIVRLGAEICDDGNNIEGDACDSNCTLPACQNGITAPGEECDDGNAVNSDGCNADCTLPICGDGIQDVTEGCDDGGIDAGDGCDPLCIEEFCGDGVVNNNGSEECDDGNQANGDACNVDCILPFCGDGLTNPEEECDDGNEIDGDECEADCTLPACNNNIVDFGEFCLSEHVTASGDFGNIIVNVGDFNVDGKLDVLMNNSFPNVFSVLFLNETGDIVSSQTTIVSASFPEGGVVGIGDLNNDSIPDIVASEDSGFFGTVRVLLGVGNGTFGPDTSFLAGVNPQSPVINDFNNDDNQDIVVANTNGFQSTVTLLLGNGDGTFQPRQSFFVGPSPFSVVAGDFNNDNNMDIVAANTNFISNPTPDTVSILLGVGDGTFQAQQTFGVGTSPFSVVIGDFNNDGNLDLATANAQSNNLSVLLGNGAGAFSPQITLPVGSFPVAVVVGDFNNDSNQDLACSNAFSSTVSVFLGNGDGSFQAQQTFVASSSQSLAVGEFNGDGLEDLLVARNSSTLLLFLSTP
jgi:cysteine-rich repeat protein